MNLLEFVNTCLENIGERRVSTLDNVVGRKAVSAVQSAIDYITTRKEWNWQTQTTVAIEWNLESAFLGDIQRVLEVVYKPLNGRRRHLTYISPSEFELIIPEPGEPIYYTINDNTSVDVTPYPVTELEKAAVVFNVVVQPQLTVSNLAELPTPKSMNNLIMYWACKELAISHLDDGAAAQMWERLFLQTLEAKMNYDRLVDRKASNMFQRRRHLL